MKTSKAMLKKIFTLLCEQFKNEHFVLQIIKDNGKEYLLINSDIHIEIKNYKEFRFIITSDNRNLHLFFSRFSISLIDFKGSTGGYHITLS